MTNKFRIAPDTAVGFVALKVENLEKQLAFYHDILKFDILSEENGMAFLGIKETKERLLVLMEKEDGIPSPYTHNGLHHLGLVVPSRVKLSKIYQQLLAHDYPVIELVDVGYAEEIFLEDPEYNVIKIYWDKPTVDTTPTMKQIKPLDKASLLAETKEPLRGLTALARVGHVHLNVHDLEQSMAFYQDVLGFSSQEVPFDSIKYLSTDKDYYDVCMSNWYKIDEETQSDENLGLDYIVFNMQSVEELEALKAHLCQRGHDYYYDKGKQVLQLDDPNGIHLWFHVKRVKK
ncbi:VOC family protein [Vagococcus lutrae]|uniref:VOC family protein n=1 Tax=Vagococcus lutrae TaxID=81947 RepID=UPI00201094DF|nr:VOC family protein [Vagococcus lutrae]MDT2806636.1 VOC family protein [Vagococcus lutrae]MDT2824015.1 VOC family protein [Vagococcus lutrae]UQF18776.1 VOC family protein [Vagococcus lutrae]